MSKNVTDKTREKMRDSALGRKLAETTKLKIKESQKKRWELINSVLKEDKKLLASNLEKIISYNYKDSVLERDVELFGEVFDFVNWDEKVAFKILFKKRTEEMVMKIVTDDWFLLFINGSNFEIMDEDSQEVYVKKFVMVFNFVNAMKKEKMK